jgi:nucleoside-diphosphate-sugar epimerase
VRANLLRLLRAVDRGMPLPLGSVRNRRSLLYVGNAAAALLAVLDSPAAGAETFFVSDGPPVSTPELVRAMARALGRRPRLLPVPEWLFRAAGRAGDLLPDGVPFPLRTAAVERLLGSLAVDPGKLRRVTGVEPPYTLAEGLAATAEWYRRTYG